MRQRNGTARASLARAHTLPADILVMSLQYKGIGSCAFSVEQLNGKGSKESTMAGHQQSNACTEGTQLWMVGCRQGSDALWRSVSGVAARLNTRLHD
jgi:hypothetical protein